MERELLNTFYEMFHIMIAVMILMLIMMIYMRYVRNTQHKSKEKRKKDTMDFCFNDKINYEKIIYSQSFKMPVRWNEYSIDETNLPILAQFDKISIALKHDVFDESVIFDYYGKYFIYFYSQCRYFILQRREEAKNPDLFIEYEKLVRRWENNCFGN